MRAAYFVLIAMSCVALLCGGAFASNSANVSPVQRAAETSPKVANTNAQGAEGNNGKTQASGNRSGTQKNLRVRTNQKQSAIRPIRIKNNHARQVSKNTPRPTFESSSNLNRVDSAFSANAKSSALTQNQKAPNAVPVRPGVARPGANSLNPVRHRNPNPAIVNGSVSSIGKGAGVLDGTRMNRKL